MIYDCFTFFNELELLELRLELLDPYVDFFVISESTKTHSGITKPLYYIENAHRFDNYSHKIIHIIADDFPQFDNSWSYENYQRNALSVGLLDCKPTDTILISDIDEIPNLERLPKFLMDGVVYCFLQEMYFYYINNYKSSHLIWEGGSKAVTYRTISDSLLNEKYVKYNSHSFSRKLNFGPTLTKIRLYRGLAYISSGGWHLSYMGGTKSIQNKLSATSHQEINRKEINSESHIMKCLESGIDLLDSTSTCYIRTFDKFPSKFFEILPKEFFLLRGRTQSNLKYNLKKNFEVFLIYTRNLVRCMLSNITLFR